MYLIVSFSKEMLQAADSDLFNPLVPKAPNSDSEQSWALSVFFNFFNNKKLFFCIFYQVNNLFLLQSYLKSLLPVKLT